MRRRLASLPRPVRAGILLFAFAWGLYSVTTQPLTGYEPETAAVTEGLVRDGNFRDKTDSILPLKADLVGEGGYTYARTGILQVLLEAPFMAAGFAVDNTAGHFSAYPNGYAFTWFFNPFMAAIAVVAMFAIVFQARRSLRWATSIALLFAVASLAWPYSKIGMETTFMAMIMVAFAVGLWARRSPSVLSWGLTGFATGAAVATKAYAILSLIPIFILLLPRFLELERREQLRLGAAVVLPVLFWGAVIGWHNWVRFGSVTDFGYPPSPWTVGAPLNFLGLLFSPGKGLIFYSPLVVLGALGLPRLWRADRTLTLALLSFLVTLTALSGTSTYWGDEVWGPRYIVPAAWVLLVPIAWWADTVTRRKVLVGLAAVGVLVQVLAVSVSYSKYTEQVRGLTGVPIYRDRVGVPVEQIPYGNDGTRWVPELSALVVQSEALISAQVLEPFGLDGLKVTYAPFEGRSRTIDFGERPYKVRLAFWWAQPPRYPELARVLALAIALAAFACAAGLYRVVYRREPSWDDAGTAA